MPIGLPNHLAPHNIARAYGAASRSVSLYCLIGAAFIIIALQSASPQSVLWPALLALVPFGFALRFLSRRRSRFAAIAYLLVGGAALYWYTVTTVLECPIADHTDSFIFVLPKLALVSVGVGSGIVGMVGWAAVGFVVAEVTVGVAATQAGGQYAVDLTLAGAFLIITVLVVVVSRTRSRSASAQPSFTRADRDERLSALRYRIEVKAAAIMHDTVLGHLAALAAATPGHLAPELRTQITRDLDVLLGEEWLVDAEHPAVQEGVGWTSSPLFAVVEEARDLGLTIEVSGDVTAVTRLDPPRAHAVALAAKQCLINVIRHAEIGDAEVVVYGSETDVSVMVIDAGRGFSEAETGSDRLGLRQSVRHRIEQVDGTVQVWSTPGRGTSVMIRVPANRTDAGTAVRT